MEFVVICSGSETWLRTKNKRGGGDRRRVAAGQNYELNYFARKHGITRHQPEDLIKRVGNDRAVLVPKQSFEPPAEM